MISVDFIAHELIEYLIYVVKKCLYLFNNFVIELFICDILSWDYVIVFKRWYNGWAVFNGAILEYKDLLDFKIDVVLFLFRIILVRSSVLKVAEYVKEDIDQLIRHKHTY